MRFQMEKLTENTVGDDNVLVYKSADISDADFLKRKLWLSILTGQLFDITAFCINRKNSVS